MDKLLNISEFEKKLETYYDEILKLEKNKKPVGNKKIKSLNNDLKKIYKLSLPIIKEYSLLYGNESCDDILGEDGQIIYKDCFIDDGYSNFLELNIDSQYLLNEIEKVLDDLNKIKYKLSLNYYRISDYDLIQKIKRIKSIMKEFSCGGYYKDYEEGGKYEDIGYEYKKIYVELDQEFIIRGIENKNTFKNLQDFFNYYYNNLKLSSYAQRKNFIDNLYKDIVGELDYKKISNELKNDKIINLLVEENYLLSGDQNIDHKISHAKKNFLIIEHLVKIKEMQ